MSDMRKAYTLSGKIRRKHRGNRRAKDISKARRKQKLAKELYFLGQDRNWYDNLHQFSKNKIHCSCGMCSAKTNSKRRRGKGISDSPLVKTTRWGSGVDRYGKNYKTSERRVIESMREQIKSNQER